MKKKNESHTLLGQHVKEVSMMDKQSLFEYYGTTEKGLSLQNVQERQKRYGENVVNHTMKHKKRKQAKEALFNPFTMVLLLLALVSFIMDFWLRPSSQRDFRTVAVVLVMVGISAVLKYAQESKSSQAAEKLKAFISTTTRVCRMPHGTKEIPLSEVVPR
ncbi:MAG: cation-transporting P-type ATPase [Erysipelotrichaceae bacterium]